MRHRSLHRFRVGSYAYVHVSRIVKTLRPIGTARKLSPRWYGPYRIDRMVTPVTALLRLPSHWRSSRLFHVSCLKPAPAAHFHAIAASRPGPIAPDTHPDWFAEEKLLDTRLRGRQRQYLVKWVGYPRSEATWEPVGNLTEVPRLIADFHRDQAGPSH